MKIIKALCIILSVCFILALCSCGGNVGEVKIKQVDSKIYTQKDIDDAINVIIREFEAEWNHCKLLEIGYIGDDYNEVESFDHWAKQYKADEAILLISSFYVDKSAADDPYNTFNSDSVYENWNWILVRDKGGSWRHVDHGY